MNRHFLVLFACCLSLAKAASQEPAVPIKEIVDLLKPLSSIKNVQVSGSARESEYNRRTKSFDKLVTSVEVTALLDARAGSRISITYAPLRSTWMNGKEAYFDEYKTVTFNGTQWVSAIDKQGPSSSVYDYHRAVVSEKSPYPEFFPRWETGEMFWLSNLLVFNKTPITDVVKNASGYTISVSRESGDGDELLKIVVADDREKPSQRDTFWLSKDHGWALTRRVTQIGILGGEDRGLRYEYTVNSFARVAPGIDLPSSGERKLFINGIPDILVEWHSSAIAVNVEEPDQAFQARLSPGWRVEDERYGTSFIVGQKANDVINGLKNGNQK